MNDQLFDVDAVVTDPRPAFVGNGPASRPGPVGTPAARTSDPWTSWAAAKSIVGLRSKQAAVLYVLSMTSEGFSLSQLVEEYRNPPGAPLPTQSDSGIRTRCKELQALGLVEVVGERKNESGRTERVLRTVSR